jgi:hypothetical protein
MINMWQNIINQTAYPRISFIRWSLAQITIIKLKFLRLPSEFKLTSDDKFPGEIMGFSWKSFSKNIFLSCQKLLSAIKFSLQKLLISTKLFKLIMQEWKFWSFKWKLKINVLFENFCIFDSSSSENRKVSSHSF